MASGRNKKRRDIIADRLSNLPDDVIYKILSFVGVKDRVRTGSLSSRWRYLWTSMPFLYFSSHNFPLIHNFYQSALNVLSNRDNQIQVSSLYLRIFEVPDDAFVNRVLDYAFSHNVQELTVGCEKEFHLFNFSSQSLKVLTLASIGFEYSSTRTSDWELPALTTLHLIGVTLYEEDFELEDYEDVRESWDEFFSKCPNLKNLTFKDCSIGSCGFTICHPHLHNLTLANGDWGLTTFTVDTPQLKTLSIINCGYVELLSAPHLTSFIYRHFNAFEFDVESLPSLEKVDFCICKPHEGNMKDIVDVLQKFQSVKFLTINAEISELLSSELELISNRHSPFANLTSLKIYPAIIDELEEYDYHNDNDDDDDDEYEFKYELKYEDEDENEDEHEEEDEDKEEAEGERDEDKDEDEEEDGDEEEDEDDEEEDGDEDDEVNIEVKNFFLNSSPSATVTKVTREEIRAVTTPELAINLLKELQVLLKEEKAKIIMARKKQGKAPMKSHATELHQQVCSTEERMISTESRWEDPSVQHYLEKGKIGPMVSKLQAIKGVLATLPTSKRAVMKAVCHRVFAEANLVMKKIEDANSHNIGEEHVEEKLPQNQKEFVPTQGRWGKSYKRQWRKRYSRRPKQQGPLISE